MRCTPSARSGNGFSVAYIELVGVGDRLCLLHACMRRGLPDVALVPALATGRAATEAAAEQPYDVTQRLSFTASGF